MARILVVDDDPVLRPLLAAQLAPHDVTTAANGFEGLELARSVVFDLIVLDVVMPLMTGIEACAAMRASDVRAPVLFLSALADVEARNAALRAGGNAWLSKPAERADVLGEVARLLGSGAPT
jgi:CheY-like chemotaxis protein